ncbi:MAG: hypothetical protein COY81_00190 [Candidatus Pacebacteria bacterium CG_4_10_14_0_8_um_filter_43_12]|nr:MAG: hypothetical protein COY81_00190 [Candidatus Pacebacteria bacterium CG_4_10_14_0_8_um_filter_43_12]
MKLPLVSIIIVVYNNEAYVKRCLYSVLAATYPSKEIIVIDNGSSDNSLRILSEFKTKIKLVKNQHNLGYAEANNAGFRLSKGNYVFILNPDTVVNKDFLEPLVVTLASSPTIAACQPAIFLLNHPKELNLSEKTTHYLGFDWITNHRSTNIPPLHEIVSFSGSAVLIKRSSILFNPLFDSTYFMYYEDTDLSWKLRLLGYKIIFQPKSKIYHDYKLFPPESYLPSKKKLMLLERNRLATMLKNYSTWSQILIFPAFLLVELGMFVYAISTGWGKAKLMGYLYLWRNRVYLWQARNIIQSTRKISDKEIVKDFSATIKFVYADTMVMKWIINPFLFLYWKVIGQLI